MKTISSAGGGFSHSRQAQPGGRPALHQEQGALVAKALGCYLEEALVFLKLVSRVPANLFLLWGPGRIDRGDGRRE